MYEKIEAGQTWIWQPGQEVSDICLLLEVHPDQLYSWVSLLRDQKYTKCRLTINTSPYWKLLC